MPRIYKIRTIKEHLDLHTKKTSDCWLWTGTIDKGGYGILSYTIDKKHLSLRAHRASYEFYKNKITTGLVIDHLCRNRACVNPEHLEPVTIGENVRRGVKVAMLINCKNGHLFDEANTYVTPDNRRNCKRCIYLSVKKWQHKKREERLSLK